VIEELWRKPYRRARLMTFLRPFENIKGTGYQLAQAILAVGSGGWFGKGFGASQLKLMYLPKPHTDFIFPVICEELGLVGALVILGLYAAILIRGIRVARLAPNLFGTLLACGITFSIVLQAFFNIAMAIGLLPTKGIPLPFLSFGGSSLLSTLMGVGVLLSISRQSRESVA
jgi:cell division protein FtsW